MLIRHLLQPPADSIRRGSDLLVDKKGNTMTERSKVDISREIHQDNISREVLAAVEFELVGSIAHAGGVLRGLSVKFGDSECLMTLRAVLAGKPQVSFVGAPDLPSCFRKAVVDAYHDELRWREDVYARKED